MKCCVCEVSGETTVLKPWGPGRQPICFRCAHNDPERTAIAGMYYAKEQSGKNPNVKIIPLAIESLPAVLASLLGLDESEPPPENCPCDVCSARRAVREHKSPQQKQDMN